MIYNVVFVSGVQQSESALHIHISILLRLSSHMGHCRVLSRLPCAEQQVLIGIVYFKFSEGGSEVGGDSHTYLTYLTLPLFYWQ